MLQLQLQQHCSTSHAQLLVCQCLHPRLYLQHHWVVMQLVVTTTSMDRADWKTYTAKMPSTTTEHEPIIIPKQAVATSG
jgi:hypothetical protein